VNIGNLLLARGAARTREFAIRVATGAARGRLLRQLITETGLIFLFGALAGLIVASLVVQGLTGFFAIGRTPIVLDVHYDWRPVVFAITVSMIAAVATGLWPALRASRTHPHAAMKDGDVRLAGARGTTAAGRLLVASQVALSLILVVGALLFVSTIANLRSVDLGFNNSRVLTMSLDPMIRQESTSTRPRYWAAVLSRVRGLGGIESASLSVLTPLSGRDTGKAISVKGFEPRSDADRMVRLNHVSEDYFRTFGIPLVAGRVFTAADAPDAARVAIVNEAAAAAYFGGRTPIGESIAFGDRVYQVVGVVRDHKHRNVREPAPRFVFVPLWQPVDPVTRITLAVASSQPPARLARVVADEARAVAASTLVSDVIGIEEQIDATMVSERLLSTIASALATLALALAAIGLYGVLSYSVARRTTEFGVRLTLGARPVQLIAAVFSEVAFELVLAFAIGLPLAVLVARAAEGMLFGVASSDPAIYVASIIMLTTVAAAAAWLPARRAGNIEPIAALRSE
jgi:predicted permease